MKIFFLKYFFLEKAHLYLHRIIIVKYALILVFSVFVVFIITMIALL